jgi:hypothetical protein
MGSADEFRSCQAKETRDKRREGAQQDRFRRKDHLHGRGAARPLLVSSFLPTAKMENEWPGVVIVFHFSDGRHVPRKVIPFAPAATN